ncbi:SRPBCC family protein [Natronolimnohabitans innermongolicus]|uniref:Cyclase/dehydrase n=1 Tax=Natronolimnohabitans innermongolicus JCM 12255 TaxID=1227499 RepID=L9XJ63_9EURY|nr:SRPBCC family protein [Natronolimnohabitans innermongolicus]ELY61632.1 cyclase/dehydrase [Natronolimnohabitans innermongolicus JCM 12255]
MAVYERQTTIDAPLESVWQFYSRVEGLEAVTPDWMGLRIESVIGPDGEANPDPLVAGSEVALSMRPFGVGPRQYVTSRITVRERTDGGAVFRDEMIHGPFAHWLHTHAFYPDGERTILRDRVEYELPGGESPGIGRLVGVAASFAWLGFEPMFRVRHRRTKVRLESV